MKIDKFLKNLDVNDNLTSTLGKRLSKFELIHMSVKASIFSSFNQRQ